MRGEEKEGGRSLRGGARGRRDRELGGGRGQGGGAGQGGLGGGEGIAEGDGEGSGKRGKIAEPKGAVRASEVAAGVGGEEKGNLLEGGKCAAGEGVVSEEVGEGGKDGKAERGVVRAGKNYVDLVTEGVGRAAGAGTGGVGHVESGGEGQKLMCGQIAALAAQPEEGDSGDGGQQPEVEGGFVEVWALEVGGVEAKVRITACEGWGGRGGVKQGLAPEVGDGRPEGAGVRTLEVTRVASAGEAGRGDDDGPLVGLEQGEVGLLDRSFEGGGGGRSGTAEAEKPGGEGGR